MVQFYENKHGITVLKVENVSATAEISLFGGHLLSYTPSGKTPVVWLSAHADLSGARPIRGGVPICWPWFGSHPEDPGKPSHGFARTLIWNVESIKENGPETTVVLCLKHNAKTLELWPYVFELRQKITVGERLTMKLETHNLSEKSMEITQALHSYFSVSDITKVSISGLEGAVYKDELDGGKEKQQNGIITFSSEVDRDYIHTNAACRIHDGGGQRVICVEKSRSDSTVIWNPWVGKAARMSDFGDDEYLNMVCVETTNVTEHDTVTVSPGESYSIVATVFLEG